jgi:hypothetical protein
MEVVIVLLVIVIITALVLGWVALCMTAMIFRLLVRVVASPFRVAGRADAAIARRLSRPRLVRLQRVTDVQCGNRLCAARLPNEARYCARCGAAVVREQLPVAMPVARLPVHGFTQVA